MNKGCFFVCVCVLLFSLPFHFSKQPIHQWGPPVLSHLIVFIATHCWLLSFIKSLVMDWQLTSQPKPTLNASSICQILIILYPATSWPAFLLWLFLQQLAEHKYNLTIPIFTQGLQVQNSSFLGLSRSNLPPGCLETQTNCAVLAPSQMVLILSKLSPLPSPTEDH